MAARGATDDGGVPIAQRVDQIAINMDRWRWLPGDLGGRYLIVNIPAYRLDAVENGRSVLGMKVVVGKRENPTPVLADKMTSIVFSPYWNIPPDIVTKETLPHVLNDPAYLERNNIEVVRASNDATPVDAARIDWQSSEASGLNAGAVTSLMRPSITATEGPGQRPPPWPNENEELARRESHEPPSSP